MKKIFRSVMFLFLTALLLSSCGNKEDASQTSQTAEQPETIDWKTEGFAVSGDVEEYQKYWVVEYIPWKHENVDIDPETEQLLRLSDPLPRVYDGRIYRMNTVINPPYFQAARWILEIYDTETMSSSVREFSYEQLGEENTRRSCFLTGMDLINEDSFIFQWMEMKRNSDDLYHQTVSRMIYVNSDDIHTTDLWDTYLEKGIARDDFQEFLTFPTGYCVCDSAGNTYQKAGSTNYGYTQLYVMDRDGAVLLEYTGAPEQAIEDPMRTESGELIFPVYDNRESCYYFMWPDTETGKMHTLGTINESTYIRQLFGMQGNIIYYETSNGIVTWDIKSGKRTLAFCYRDNGITFDYQTMLVLRRGQAPLLRLYRNSSDGDEDWLAPLSEEPVQRADAIRVADLVCSDTGSRLVSECAALVTRKDLNQTITYERAKQDAETFRTQIMAELMAGKGPDILYVSRSDMALLQDMGLLADLNSLIPQETLNELWPGVIQMGTLEGKLAGLPGNITTALGMAVARDTWSKDTWQLEDIIALMADGSLENAVFYPSAKTYFQPLGTTRTLIEYSLEDSFLIDWEKRESHFEDERFIRLLEMTKDSRDSLSDDMESWFHGGKSIAFFHIGSYHGIYHFGDFADSAAGNYVGFPTTGGFGNYMESPGMLVVNANAQNAEGISVYLNYFLGKDIQHICDYDYTLSVRRFSTEEIEQSSEGDFLWRGEKLSVMEDGSTSLHRAIAFLESCVPAPAQHPELWPIIQEELGAFYSGDKSARQTAEIIDSRIQVYLDENN